MRESVLFGQVGRVVVVAASAVGGDANGGEAELPFFTAFAAVVVRSHGKGNRLCAAAPCGGIIGVVSNGSRAARNGQFGQPLLALRRNHKLDGGDVRVGRFHLERRTELHAHIACGSEIARLCAVSAFARRQRDTFVRIAHNECVFLLIVGEIVRHGQFHRARRNAHHNGQKRHQKSQFFHGKKFCIIFATKLVDICENPKK